MRTVEPVNYIEKYRYLVYKCMKGIKIPPYMEPSDVEQAGYEGLITAEKRYDPNKQIGFISYAIYYIKGYILRAVYKNYSLLSKIGIHRLEKKLVDDTPIVVPIPTSLENDDDYDWRCVPVSKDDINKTEKTLDYYNLKKLYDLFFKSLSPQQKQALELYYFTMTKCGKHTPCKDIANIMGLRSEEVHQLLHAGRKALRTKFGKYLDVYI